MGKCQICCMLTPLCICALLNKIEASFRLVLLLHWTERRKSANSGRIAAAKLASSESYIVGEPHRPLDWSGICEPGCENLFLFPAPDAEVVTAEFWQSLTLPIRLIVPDGNWGQANRMNRRISQHGSPRKIILPPGAPSNYRLRSAPDKPDGISTLEAIARVAGIAGQPEVESALTSVFEIMVERNLFARGKLHRADVRGGIPSW